MAHGSHPSDAEPAPDARARSATVQHLLDLVFLIGVLVKGVDGLVQLVVGIPLLFLSQATLMSLAHGLTARELLEDPHDLIANLLMSGVAGLKPQDMFTLGIYIAVHGAVKVAIVVALAVGAVRVYPWAIGALGILTIVQIVDLVVNPAIGVILLTVLDLIVIALTWREWRERRSLWDTFAATAAWVRRRPAPAGA